MIVLLGMINLLTLDPFLWPLNTVVQDAAKISVEQESQPEIEKEGGQ